MSLALKMRTLLTFSKKLKQVDFFLESINRLLCNQFKAFKTYLPMKTNNSIPNLSGLSHAFLDSHSFLSLIGCSFSNMTQLTCKFSPKVILIGINAHKKKAGFCQLIQN